ncbi:uncharacterized protein LOC135501515 [Lineus longissimus]|uniref:uncharacterized protein LOC135501515 n=1 Tax=Lineus longissimus TaxID=88925 RepID=UPI00315CA780
MTSDGGGTVKASGGKIEIDTELAISNAKAKVLTQLESGSYQASMAEIKLAEQEPRDHSQCASPIKADRAPLRESAKTFAPNRTHTDEIHTPRALENFHHNGTTYYYPPPATQTASNDVLVTMIQEMKKPQSDIKKFSGDPLEYRRFLRQFNSRIVANTIDSEEMINYLEQYTSGEANRIVIGYACIDANNGYQGALKELEERYGDPERIAHAYIKKALEWPMVKADDARGLDEFSIFLAECENAVQVDGSIKILEYPDNLTKLVRKLPYYLHDRWRNIVGTIKERKGIVRFENLVAFVKKEANKSIDPVWGRAALAKEDGRNKEAPRGGKPAPVQGRFRAKGAFATTTPTTPIPKKQCLHCANPQHSIDRCDAFAALPTCERVEIVKAKRACFGCLKLGHRSKECRTRLTCSHCQKRHPTVLHMDGERPYQPSTKTEERKIETAPSKPTVNFAATESDPEVTMAIIPVKVKLKSSYRTIDTYAFLDPGSTVNFCSEELMRKLGAGGRKTRITLDTMGTEHTMQTYVVKDLEVCDIEGHSSVDISKLYTKDSIPVSSRHIPKQEDIIKWPQLNEVNLPVITSEVGLLIRNGVPDAYSPLKSLTGPPGSTHAVKTRLGWVTWNVVRSSCNRPDIGHPVNHVEVTAVEELEKLDRLVRSSINLDFPEKGIEETKFSQEDKQFMELMEESIHVKDGHYEMKLPFRREDIRLPNNYTQAMQRLSCLKNKMSRNSKFHQDYRVFMHEIINKGYAEEVPADELNPDDGKVWYIPHHGVYHPRKPEKIRVVFDCSAKYAGISINDVLLQGPNLTNNLVGVLLRFRRHPVAILADIEKMFYQVHVAEEDRNYLRFVWWPDGSLEAKPKAYRMKVHLFGAVSSPSCSNLALQRTAKDHKEGYQVETINAMLRSFYVDDCLESIESEAKAVALIKELRKICQEGGFKLTKWLSNRRSVLDFVPTEERSKGAKTLNLDEDDLPTERTLGVTWQVETDSFSFQINIQDRQANRRGILSIISSVYDPLGLAAPFILPANILLQSLCHKGLDWDQEISGADLQKWQIWIQDLPKLENHVVQRCMKPLDFGDVSSSQLHHFADASEVGYGTASYIRLENTRGNVHCALLLGKARVAPLKKNTIPRLELAAAVTAVRMNHLILKELDYPVDATYFWTDSTAVLRYIRNKTSRFKTFVANRIAVINEGSPIEQWYHVPTSENPADDASRGLPVNQFLENGRWTGGPDFLLKPPDEWPKFSFDADATTEEDPEIRKESKSAVNATIVDSTPLASLFERVSRWPVIKGAVARMLKWRTTQTGEDRQADPTVNDLEEAERKIIQHEQKSFFSDEINAIEKGIELRRSSLIQNLDPLMEDGILRVESRLSRAPALSYQQKHPILIPKQSLIATRIIERIHRDVGHLGRGAVLTNLRERYWIPGAISLIKQFIAKCVICRRYRAKALEQKMANLPIDRVIGEEPPFTRIGMDYFGPFEVMGGRSVYKRYGVVFTCFAIRAVHIELAHTLDTSSCIQAIRRFMARRGAPKVIRSDNGTNLVGAKRELQDSIKCWNNDRIATWLLQKGVTWEFNPPAASHFGGAWERQIRTIRKILFSLLQEQVIKVDDEGLTTLFCEVENIINSRPLTQTSEDPSDLRPLTPNTLLTMRCEANLPPGLFDRKACYAKRRWRQMQFLADAFWKRWYSEYLPTLQERHKWRRTSKNVEPGDVVLVIENSAPRNSWLLAKVESVKIDGSGHVRSASVRTSHSLLERPIAKLCLLVEGNKGEDELPIAEET